MRQGGWGGEGGREGGRVDGDVRLRPSCWVVLQALFAMGFISVANKLVVSMMARVACGERCSPLLVTSTAVQHPA